MKEGIHPDYRNVVIKDSSSGWSILTKSCARSNQTVQWEDGQDYPLVLVETSSASHPFFTGKHKVVDSAGRIEKFKRRYEKSNTDKSAK